MDNVLLSHLLRDFRLNSSISCKLHGSIQSVATNITVGCLIKLCLYYGCEYNLMKYNNFRILCEYNVVLGQHIPIIIELLPQGRGWGLNNLKPQPEAEASKPSYHRSTKRFAMYSLTILTNATELCNSEKRHSKARPVFKTFEDSDNLNYEYHRAGCQLGPTNVPF